MEMMEFFMGEVLNDGSIFGARWVDGKIGKALQFDGVDDYVEISHSDTLNLQNFTIAAWVKAKSKPSAAPYWDFIAWKWLSYGLAIDEYVYPNRFLIGFYDGEGWHTLEGGKLTDEWQFVVGTWDGTYLKLYINGELVKQTDKFAGYSVAESTESLWIGGMAGEERTVNGIIDEVRIYNRALTEEEIKAIYENNTFIQDGLIAFWRFDEGKGNIAHDSHHIVYESHQESSGFGKALSFDGVDDYVEITEAVGKPLKDFTLVTWVKTTYSGERRMIVSAGNDWDYHLDMRPWGAARVQYYDGANWHSAESTSLINDGRWHHVAGTYGLINGKLLLRIYVDGILEEEKEVTSYPRDTGPRVRVGVSQGAPIDFWNGTIDEVRIYNRALSEEEIKQIYLGPIKVSLISEETIPFNGSYFKLKGLSRDYSCSGKLICNHSYIGPIDLQANVITDIYIRPRVFNCDLLGSGVYELCLIIQGRGVCKQFIIS